MSAPVLLDMTRAVGRRWRGRTASGIDRVCDAYAAHLGGRAQAVLQARGKSLVMGEAASRDLFAVLDAPTAEFRKEFARLLLCPPHPPHHQYGASYLNVGHSGFDAKGHWAWIARQNLAPIYLLHDLIPITHPHVTTPRKTARHRERVVRALAGGAGLIANSRATAHSLRDFARAENLPLPPLLIAPIAGGLPPAQTRPVAGARPVFVSVGTIEKRKNHLLLLRVWRALIDRMGEDAPRLVLAGDWGRGAGPLRETLRRDPQLAQFVEVRAGLDDAAIAALVAQAKAVLLPTLAEGFGMPLIEALALGVPVIASDLPSLREIGQGIPCYIEGENPEAWAQAVFEFCADGPRRQRQLAMMPHFREPSWADHFEAFDIWLGELQDSARRPVRSVAATSVCAHGAANSRPAMAYAQTGRKISL